MRRSVHSGRGLLFCVAFTVSIPARAQVVEFNASSSIWYEKPTGGKMLVYSPGVELKANPTEWLSVTGGWEADVVSGASVAVKAGPAYQNTHPGADVITSASVHDFRNVARGNIAFTHNNVTFNGGYSYGIEHDYKSNTMSVGAKTDFFEHNTQFEINYAHNFDSVCNRTQTPGVAPTLYVALENSVGCFKSSSATRTTSPIAIDGFQASWAQSWTQTFTTQATFTAQILNGFQSNPYRSVILDSGTKAQEHVPTNRARESLAIKGIYFIKPIRAAVRLSLRGYWDTWAIKSGTVEAEFEKYFGESFRVQINGRAYAQTGAVFWSDDYTGGTPPLGPRGQYWTGDREESPFTSFMGGVRLLYAMTRHERRIGGIFTGLKFSLWGDVIQFNYSEFTLAGTPITNARGYLAGFSINALF